MNTALVNATFFVVLLHRRRRWNAVLVVAPGYVVLSRGGA